MTLYEARIRAGHSQVSLAWAAGCTRDTIRSVERGERPPIPSTRRGCERALGPIDWEATYEHGRGDGEPADLRVEPALSSAFRAEHPSSAAGVVAMRRHGEAARPRWPRLMPPAMRRLRWPRGAAACAA